MSSEKWKKIPGYKGKYIVSNMGNVRAVMFFTKKGFVVRELKKQYSFGYETVMLNQKSKLLHRIIAEAFIPNPNNKPEINHKNGKRKDNRISNLEWCTRSENAQHAWDTGLACYKGERNKSCIQVSLDGFIVNEFSSRKEAFQRTGIRHISECINGLRKTSGGYVWL